MKNPILREMKSPSGNDFTKLVIQNAGKEALIPIVFIVTINESASSITVAITSEKTTVLKNFVLWSKSFTIK